VAIRDEQCLLRGVVLIFLTPDGQATPNRPQEILGSLVGNCVRLAPAPLTNEELFLCRSIELGLNILRLGFRPVWAYLEGPNLVEVKVPDSVGYLTIVDTERDQIARDVASEARRRFKTKNRTIRRVTFV
jgi:hypothetical protein